MKLSTKNVLAGSAIALMLLPFAASADTGHGLKLGSLFGFGKAEVHANINANIGNKDGDENRGKNDNEHATSSVFAKQASTTVTNITRQANRIKAAADLFSSFGAALSTRIASSSLSASSTATANAKLADYTSALSSAKAQADAAIAAAAGINASNSTTTNATLTATAKADLKAASDFLKTAQKDFRLILQLIFRA